MNNILTWLLPDPSQESNETQHPCETHQDQSTGEALGSTAQTEWRYFLEGCGTQYGRQGKSILGLQKTLGDIYRRNQRQRKGGKTLTFLFLSTILRCYQRNKYVAQFYF